MNRSFRAVAALVAILTIVPLECNVKAFAADGLAKVKIGATPSLLYLPVYIALDQGLFAKHGIEADLVPSNTPTPALIAGEVDFLARGADEGVVAAARGKSIPAVVMLQQRNSLSLDVGLKLARLVGNKSFPENIRLLKGHNPTIGVPARGGASDLFIAKILQTADMVEGRDYSMVIVGSGANLVGALKADRIDIALLWPPYSQQAYAEKALSLVQQAKKEGPEALFKQAGIALMANAPFLANNEKTTRNLINAIVEAAAFNRDFAKNKKELIRIAKKFTGLNDEAVLETAVESEAVLAYPGADCEAWTVTARNMMAIKAIEKEPACSELIAGIAPKGPLGP